MIFPVVPHVLEVIAKRVVDMLPTDVLKMIQASLFHPAQKHITKTPEIQHVMSNGGMRRWSISKRFRNAKRVSSMRNGIQKKMRRTITRRRTQRS
jgi:hypothetical protein